MKTNKSSDNGEFVGQALHALTVPIAHRVNRLGGYGPAGEVIYEDHPLGCPSVLVDTRGSANATFMSNGSVAFGVKLPEGMDVSVLDASWDLSEKREIAVPSQNVWISLGAWPGNGPAHRQPARIASLINPNVNVGLPADSIRIVKLGDPGRAMWYCARFKLAGCETAVRFSMVSTDSGPAILRQVFIRNTGRKPLAGSLWGWFNLHGTQRFVYNKDLWYDTGMPISGSETVVTATVPYSSILQIKRVSSQPRGMKFAEATCDYSTFIGDTSSPAVLPQAVLAGRMLPGGAGGKLNRFSTPTGAASKFTFTIAPGGHATLQQSLLYVTDAEVIAKFREASSCASPSYRDTSKAFLAAAKQLIAATPGVGDALAPENARVFAVAGEPETAKAQAAGALQAKGGAHAAPFFQVALPAEPAVSAYANSVWIGVRELYENCRAHGAKLANGIELGTRDRAQDMWPWMKENPAQVRGDLVHAMSMMYQTCDKAPVVDHRLSLREKLHGMFPRQYPSRWDDRTQEIFNDNRPYNDSATWFVNSTCMYIRETGDASILHERVGSVRLTSPDRPETSGLVGGKNTFTIAEVIVEVLECLRRHAVDSPYGLVQVLYGDWCDPIDMYGTSVVGDASTRGHGRGVQARLSAHVFCTLVEVIDLFTSPNIAKALNGKVAERVEALKSFANELRQNIVRVAWEGGKNAGFVAWIHELRGDGSTPDYAKGELGYTLGSMLGRDFDGVARRDLATQAWCLAMLTTRRDWLSPLPDAPTCGRAAKRLAAGPQGRASLSDTIITALLDTIDSLFYSPKLGLALFTTPIANSKLARDLVGRMGILPPGCAENGEYHHGQVMMHRFRLDVPDQAGVVWRQFKPMLSVSRDESLAGPFETPCTSYASDRNDPHFGKGMYFGLSGSVDWIVQVVHKLAGLELNLHDPRLPAISVNPTLPPELKDTLTFRRVIHVAQSAGQARPLNVTYRQVPLTISIRREGTGKRLIETRTAINGKQVPRAEIADLAGLDRVEIEIVRVYGK